MTKLLSFILLASLSNACIELSNMNLEGEGKGAILNANTSVGAYEDQMLGWTQFVPSADSRIIYVSSSTGNDSNDGLSALSPKRTIVAGADLMRNGFPDYLLLKRGDRFDESGLRNSFGSWQASGRSETEKMLISAYGTGFDPQLSCPENPCARIWGRKHLAIVGLEFYLAMKDPEAPEYNASVGNFKALEIRYDIEDLLLEGNRFRFFRMVEIDKADGGVKPKDILIRRNLFLDHYYTGTHTQGLYISSTDGVTIEENIFDHNGWLPSGGKMPSIFDHNIYANQNFNMIVRRNIFSRASSMGLKVRSDLYRGVQGLLIEDNLFLQNPIGISLGGLIPAGGTMYVDATLKGNVITEGGRDQPNFTNWGITVGGADNLLIEQNYFVHNPYPQSPVAIDIANLPMTNVRVRENKIYNFSFVGIDNHSSSGVSLTNNFIEGMLPEPQFVDPQRSVSSYLANLGMEFSSDAFIERLRQQSYGNWSQQLSVMNVLNYMKQGFQLQP